MARNLKFSFWKGIFINQPLSIIVLAWHRLNSPCDCWDSAVPRALALCMKALLPTGLFRWEGFHLFVRNEGGNSRRGEFSAISACRRAWCETLEPEEPNTLGAQCVQLLVAEGMCSACDKHGRAVCHQCYLKANETGINNCAVESLSVAPCLSLTIYIS